jgi:hypothetical protein
MKSAVFWGLAALNVLLVAVLVNRYLPDNAAHAQAGRPSEYLMVPGKVIGVSSGVVFIVDTSRGELSAMTFDATSNELKPLHRIPLDQVFRSGAGVGAGGGGGGGPGVGRVKPR